MGFSMVGSFGHHVFVRNSTHRTVKFGSFRGKKLINYNVTIPKFKTCAGTALLCKREFVDFEERSSPDEVSSVFSFIKATNFCSFKINF